MVVKWSSFGYLRRRFCNRAGPYLKD